MTEPKKTIDVEVAKARLCLASAVENLVTAEHALRRAFLLVKPYFRVIETGAGANDHEYMGECALAALDPIMRCLREFGLLPPRQAETQPEPQSPENKEAPAKPEGIIVP